VKIKKDTLSQSEKDFLDAVLAYHRTVYVCAPDECYPPGELPRKMQPSEIRMPDGSAGEMQFAGRTVQVCRGTQTFWLNTDPSGRSPKSPFRDPSQAARAAEFLRAKEESDGRRSDVADSKLPGVSEAAGRDNRDAGETSKRVRDDGRPGFEREVSAHPPVVPAPNDPLTPAQSGSAERGHYSLQELAEARLRLLGRFAVGSCWHYHAGGEYMVCDVAKRAGSNVWEVLYAAVDMPMVTFARDMVDFAHKFTPAPKDELPEDEMGIVGGRRIMRIFDGLLYVFTENDAPPFDGPRSWMKGLTKYELKRLAREYPDPLGWPRALDFYEREVKAQKRADDFARAASSNDPVGFPLGSGPLPFVSNANQEVQQVPLKVEVSAPTTVRADDGSEADPFAGLTVDASKIPRICETCGGDGHSYTANMSMTRGGTCHVCNGKGHLWPKDSAADEPPKEGDSHEPEVLNQDAVPTEADAEMRQPEESGSVGSSDGTVERVVRFGMPFSETVTEDVSHIPLWGPPEPEPPFPGMEPAYVRGDDEVCYELGDLTFWMHRDGSWRGELQRTEKSAADALTDLTPEERLAMAKTAPSVAGPWCHEEADDFHWRSEHMSVLQNDGSGPRRFARCALAGVTPWPDGSVSAETRFGDLGSFPSVAAGRSACDAALLAAGYVLDGES